MREFNKILVAIAFSQYSEGIFRYAAQLADRLGADLVSSSIINQRAVDAIRLTELDTTSPARLISRAWRPNGLRSYISRVGGREILSPQPGDRRFLQKRKVGPASA